jgi:hypothetical protein
MQHLRGDFEPRFFPEALERYFMKRLYDVCLEATEAGRTAASSAWETEVGQTPDYQKRLAEWDQDFEEAASSGYRGNEHRVHEQYCEWRFGRNSPLRNEAWDNRWRADWTVTWEQVWNNEWPPFSWNHSRADLQFEGWERDIAMEEWDDFVRRVADNAWSHGGEGGLPPIRRHPGPSSFEEACVRWLREEMALLITDVFGNPFRPVTCSPAWQTPTATALAQAIYEERGFTDLPILGDALEEAGCDNAEMLAHCRQTGPHVRGCWVLDALLEPNGVSS